jgi:hypothetical protein
MTTTTAITTRTNLWRPAAVAAVVAATATTTVAAIADQAGVSLEVEGEPIPLLGFFNMTLMCVAVGFIVAVAIRRWARKPREAFVRAALALTAASFVPDLLVSAETSTRLTLMTTHIVAAAIVIPVVAKRLDTKRA